MSDKPDPWPSAAASPRADAPAADGGGSSRDLQVAITRLEAELMRCRNALELIRDRSFEQANSPRLTDQLWHFVRWSKSVAREALEGSRGDGGRGVRRP